MSGADELIEAICQTFEAKEASWIFNNHFVGGTDPVIYYLACIRYVKSKPLANEKIQHKVLEFLEKKLDEAVDKMLGKSLADFRQQISEMLEE